MWHNLLFISALGFMRKAFYISNTSWNFDNNFISELFWETIRYFHLQNVWETLMNCFKLLDWNEVFHNKAWFIYHMTKIISRLENIMSWLIVSWKFLSCFHICFPLKYFHAQSSQLENCSQLMTSHFNLVYKAGTSCMTAQHCKLELTVPR